MLRKSLVYLRREYHSNLRSFLMKAGSVFLVLVIAGTVADFTLPFTGNWNILRSAILAPLAASIFALSYIAGYHLHLIRTEDPTQEWIPYRLRFSVMWRRRIAAIVGAMLFLVTYATALRPGYTFASSCVVAAVIAIFAFIRPTKAENASAMLNIPDVRDVRYNRRLNDLQDSREAKERESNKRQAMLRRVQGREN